jgi:hypothetical protein
MPRYRIHRIKEAAGESFRWAAHTGGLAIVKPKDYHAAGEIVAATAYAAWKALAAGNDPLHPGDLLETVSSNDAPGELQIAKYIGFEPAQWYVPEPKSESGTTSLEISAPIVPSGHTHSL